MGSWTLWIGFNACILLLLALDLGLAQRRARRMPLGETLAWSALWIGLSVAFGLWILHAHGRGPALEFFTGYLIEKSLSADNLVVMLLLFQSFDVDERYQHRILFWGVLGAIVLRGGLIGAGVALIREFTWVLYVFGAFLVVAGIRLVTRSGQMPSFGRNPLVRWARKHLASGSGGAGGDFFVREGGSLRVTQLFLVLLIVESADVIFALDSIPAVFGVTRDPFIVYSSNICAVLGLRAMFSLFAILPLEYIGQGVAAILIFMGVKMLAEPWVHVPNYISLCVVGLALAVSMVASSFSKRGAQRAIRHGYGALAGKWRKKAASSYFLDGRQRLEQTLRDWSKDDELARLLNASAPSVTVGIAVTPENFEAIRKANGAPQLAEVPPEQDAMEFELHFGGGVRLDILTTKAPGAGGAIARFLEKFGEGIQQVEIETSDVDRATEILRARFAQNPIYPATRPGADGTRVNFFLVAAPDGKKLLVELVEPKKRA
ncbi:MAG: TerC/Alx family metal homeostasis membrane protein [Candidatus Acidiferrales bacterium]